MKTHSRDETKRAEPRLISLIAPPSIAPLMRAQLGARRGGVNCGPTHLRHPPETSQWVARSQRIAAVFTKKKGCRGEYWDRRDGDSGGPSGRFPWWGCLIKSAPLALSPSVVSRDLLNGQRFDHKRTGKAAST